MSKTQLTVALVLAFAVSAVASLAYAGKAEEIGKQIDNAVDSAQQSAGEAVEKAGKEVEKASQDVQGE